MSDISSAAAPTLELLAAKTETLNFEVAALRSLICALIRPADQRTKRMASDLLDHLAQTHEPKIFTGAKMTDTQRVLLQNLIDDYKKMFAD